MASRLYALLVGINDYPPAVGKLSGCLNDVDQVHDHLTSNFVAADLAIEVLKDGDATRANVIQQFGAHLGRAGEGDVALFHYCGHGARAASAREFRECYPDGRDEGIVCIDSRLPGGYDLADKELAFLISGIAKNNPHIAIVLDCCHSGSGTRGVDAFRGLKARLTHEVTAERPLASYVGGYAELRAQGRRLEIPRSRHILLAACDRGQLAQETLDHNGVFTSTLLEVLEKSGGDITYSDLFVRCRAAVRTRADNQEPQFETNGSFDASGGYLGRRATQTARRFSAFVETDPMSKINRWMVECGAIHGIPTDSDKPVALDLYREDGQNRVAGTATLVRVGPQRSEMTLDVPAAAAPALDPTVRYRAQITSLPVTPLAVDFFGDASFRDVIARVIGTDPAVNVTLTGGGKARYALAVENGALYLKQSALDRIIQGASLDASQPEEAPTRLLPALKRVAQWERSLALQNKRTAMDPAQVEFFFVEQAADGTERILPPEATKLDYLKGAGEWQAGKLKAHNHLKQPVHLLLLYFSESYGIFSLKNDPIGADQSVTLWGDGDGDYFELADGVDESLENFKLLVSTERIDDFLLSQDALDLGALVTGTRGIGSVKAAGKLPFQNEWFAKDLPIQVVRRLDRVGVADAQLADGKIIVKGHAAVTANLSLTAVTSGGRDVSGADFYKAMESFGLQMLNFSATRGVSASVLEISDIRNSAALEAQPLEVQLKWPLEPGEAILPLVYDGRHVLLGGDAYQDDDGNSHVSIRRLPAPAERSRSLGSALKLYFFKTYLKRAGVNQLRWVDYRSDGSIDYQAGEVAAKVAAAKNILLLVHGIIGDTENMARGISACGVAPGFDLVLTYDYENLNTPIEVTARQLKAQLEAAGLHADDDKKLTLLVHSMGGLVSRWFIEREGGNALVDHLVMCGTPNNGSPFGEVDGARKILTMITSVSLNYLPSLAPFSSAVLFLLNRSKKITPTLEQMNPASDFITTLNRSGDPGIPYTILAGDIHAYHEPANQFFEELLKKLGDNVLFEALFADKPNDIAVGVDSILGVAGERARVPACKNVACHHLNYFTSPAGQEALLAVPW